MFLPRLLALSALTLGLVQASDLDRPCGLKIAPCSEDMTCVPNNDHCTDLNRCLGTCQFTNTYPSCGGFRVEPVTCADGQGSLVEASVAALARTLFVKGQVRRPHTPAFNSRTHNHSITDAIRGCILSAYDPAVVALSENLLFPRSRGLGTLLFDRFSLYLYDRYNKAAAIELESLLVNLAHYFRSNHVTLTIRDNVIRHHRRRLQPHQPLSPLHQLHAGPRPILFRPRQQLSQQLRLPSLQLVHPDHLATGHQSPPATRPFPAARALQSPLRLHLPRRRHVRKLDNGPTSGPWYRRGYYLEYGGGVDELGDEPGGRVWGVPVLFLWVAHAESGVAQVHPRVADLGLDICF
ncbi:hypothetical protein V496_09677 [Pseudogymnoascus sp. VKM F-4515 (FW-2607)]|nr:hypothetical protein V496_09677 [Pseudogymnoascus sp. VKM F-4515 (FW-2607)]